MRCSIANGWARNWSGIEEPRFEIGSELEGTELGIGPEWGHWNRNWTGIGSGGLGYRAVLNFGISSTANIGAGVKHVSRARQKLSRTLGLLTQSWVRYPHSTLKSRLLRGIRVATLLSFESRLLGSFQYCQKHTQKSYFGVNTIILQVSIIL